MRDCADVELLHAWRTGDTAAGDRLVERHFASLYRFFSGYAEDVIADLVQRTWIACVEKRDLIPAGVEFRAFLFGVAHKELLMHLRKSYRGQRALARVAGADPAPATTPSDVVAARENQRLLRWAMKQLPNASRIMLELFYWEGLTLEQVAGVMGLSAAAAKSRLHRARERVRETMARGGIPWSLCETTVRGLDVARSFD